MKKLLVVLDGVGDLPCRALGGKTPLESAKKPNLDRLAGQSKTGCLNIAGKIAPESDVGVFSVLGFDPEKEQFGRGALEAVGAGFKWKNGWLGIRANFCTTDAGGRKLLDRRVARTLTTPEAKKLEIEINSKVKMSERFKFEATIAHRAVLVFKTNGGVSKRISHTDPAYVVRGNLTHAQSKFEMKVAECKPLEKTAEAVKSALLVNEFTDKAHGVLQHSLVNAKRISKGLLPANGILLRDAETRLVKPKSIFSREEWALLADMPLEVGIAKLVGMHVLKLPFPSFSASDYPIRAKKTIEALKKFDGVYVHLKGPDLFGHDGDTLGKKKSIEEIDKFYFGNLLKEIDLDEVRIAVTADHSTPCELKSHSADSVPYLVTGLGSGGRFGERHCRAKKVEPARKLMKMLAGGI